ncbi:hypothetical protein DITRI_Ditri06bG0139700 [Diplodiscus trichospermus]
MFVAKKNLGQLIGLSEPPLPYLSPELGGQKLLNGANFASAGVGILSDTGIQFLSKTYCSDNEKYQQRLSALIGAEQTSRIANPALVLITVGGNEFVNN